MEESISLTPHYHFHPRHKHLDISRAITEESSPLHIGSSRTQTGNYRFLSTSRKPSFEYDDFLTKFRIIVVLTGSLGYLALDSHIRLSITGPRPHKIFNQLNLFLGKVQSLWSCARYFQRLTGYLNQVVLLMSQVHVLKKLPYFSMCTSVVFWILSCVQLINTCSKLIIKK